MGRMSSLAALQPDHPHRRPSKPPWCLVDGLFFFFFFFFGGLVVVASLRDCTACVAQLLSGLISFDDDHHHGFCQI